MQAANFWSPRWFIQRRLRSMGLNYQSQQAAAQYLPRVRLCTGLNSILPQVQRNASSSWTAWVGFISFLFFGEKLAAIRLQPGLTLQTEKGVNPSVSWLPERKRKPSITVLLVCRRTLAKKGSSTAQSHAFCSRDGFRGSHANSCSALSVIIAAWCGHWPCWGLGAVHGTRRINYSFPPGTLTARLTTNGILIIFSVMLAFFRTD